MAFDFNEARRQIIGRGRTADDLVGSSIALAQAPRAPQTFLAAGFACARAAAATAGDPRVSSRSVDRP